jgi:predicted nucleic acid-binding protein
VAEVLLDTDVFIDHLRGARELRPGRNSLSYSVITRCELFAGANADEHLIGRLLSPFRELPVDRAIAEDAGRIRRETRIRTPDALIAATALRFGLVLVTRNASDFGRVPKLRSRTPR